MVQLATLDGLTLDDAMAHDALSPLGSTLKSMPLATSAAASAASFAQLNSMSLCSSAASLAALNGPQPPQGSAPASTPLATSAATSSLAKAAVALAQPANGHHWVWGIE